MIPNAPVLVLTLLATSHLVWLLATRQFKAQDAVPTDETESGEPHPGWPLTSLRQMEWPAIRDQAAAWLRTHWRQVSVATLALGVGMYFWILSPRVFLTELTQAGKPGHPFYPLIYVRGFITRYENAWANVLYAIVAILSLALLAVAQLRNRPATARAGILISALGLAGLGQLALLDQYADPYYVPYGLAVLFIIIWVVAYQPWTRADLLTSTWPPGLELSLLLLTMGLTAFARLYLLRVIPYGIEGDESKWAVEVIKAMIDGEFPHATGYHLYSVPLSFYMQAPFHRLLGPELISARVAVAVYSILASLAFYWLVRQISGPAVAWLATTLLAVSLLDISASRLANVESHVKLWPVLALALLVRANHTGSQLTYFLSGAAVGLGMLTYDTVAPLVVIGLLLAMYGLIRSRVPLAASVRRMTAYLVPQLVIVPVAAAYLTGRMPYYKPGAINLEENLGATLLSNLGDLTSSIFKQTHGDFLYNRSGPLFNSVLLPWLVLGGLLAIINWRRGKLLWGLLFAGLFFLPVPIVAHAPMGRVLYPGLPAAYFIIALGMVAAFRELSRGFGHVFHPALSALALLGMGFLSVSNLYIYFNEIHDPDDRRIRRALYEIALQDSNPQTRLYFSYLPGAGDAVEFEGDQVIMLGVRVNSPSKEDMHPYEVLPIASVLADLSSQASPTERVELIWDKYSAFAREERQAALDAILKCYPAAQTEPGQFFDRYIISSHTLSNPSCRAAMLTLKPRSSEVASLQPATLNWSIDYSGDLELTLECWSMNPDVVRLAGEALEGPGWEVVSRYVTGFEGSGFIADNLGSGSASMAVTLPEGAPFYVWVRSLRRVNDAFPGLIQIEEQTYQFARAGTVPLNEWVWQRIGPYEHGQTEALLLLTRPYPESEPSFMALFVDTLLITSSPSFNPFSDSVWDHYLSQSLQVEHGAKEGSTTFSAGPGDYQCQLEATDSLNLVDYLGNADVHSEAAEIHVLGQP